MKLIIDIPENTINEIRDNAMFAKEIASSIKWDITGAIVNGIPLDEVFNKIKAEIEPKCDRINSLARVLPYTAHREIQELLCEVMDLCKESEVQK